ncbi:MAG TPA: hypothetical protein VFV57_05905 [Limnobacter sp.]|nr:hypothetical protein [Limnobacter sp.]
MPQINNKELADYKIEQLSKQLDQLNADVKQNSEEYKHQLADLRKEIKEDVVAIHEKINKTAEQLPKMVLLDQKINEVAKHSDSLDQRTKDYDVIKQQATRADVAVSRVGWALAFAILAAVLGVLGLKS